MNGSRLSDYLDQMRASAADAVSFVEGMGKSDFPEDRRTQHAVTMCLQIIGESAKQILEKYPEFALERAEIRLGEMRGIRNRIAHGYVLIDQDRVWDTITADLPDLLRQL